MARKADARAFQQDLMRGEHVLGTSATAIPGGGTGKNSAYLFKTAEGYKAVNKEGSRGYGESGMAFDGGPMPDDVNVPATGTSIFDPVLSELAYRWFCPPAGVVLDPFAGGSVRGIVASKLGLRYVGIDLRPEQVEANRVQAERICEEPMPVWHIGDSRELAEIVKGVEADFVFSCPPYGDLEVYSDDERDLSRPEYPQFRADYCSIVAAACAQLKPDRFACFVVGDFRDRKGFYRGFPGHTVQAFEDAGLRLYNEAILVTAVGSLPVRVGAQFEGSRKLGKTHQNVLVFVKGDPRKATEAIGPVEFGGIDGDDAEFGEPL